MLIHLPDHIKALVAARNALRSRFERQGLRFTLDGNLVGDLGESLAAEVFGIRLESRNSPGIDGYAPDGRSVQVKATGSRLGPAFRPVEMHANHLLFLSFDFDLCRAELAYNGPERLVRAYLPETWVGQRCVSWNRIRSADRAVSDEDRLPAINGGC